MEDGLRQRLVGAAVLVLLAVIFIPMLLDFSPEPGQAGIDLRAPPDDEAGFSSRIVPLEEPRNERPDEVVVAEPDLRKGDETEGEAEANAAGEAADTLPVSSAVPAPPGGGEVPAAVREEEPRPVEVRVGAEEGAAAAWAAQLGSFADRRNAFVLRNRLRAKGYAAFTESVTGDQGEVTRVLVGPEPTRDRTLSTIEALRRDTGLDAFVVRYPRG